MEELSKAFKFVGEGTSRGGRTFHNSFILGDETFSIGDYAFFRPDNEDDPWHIGRILECFDDPEAEMPERFSVRVQWMERLSELIDVDDDESRLDDMHALELVSTDQQDRNPVGSIEKRVIVQSAVRGRVNSVSHHPAACTRRVKIQQNDPGRSVSDVTAEPWRMCHSSNRPKGDDFDELASRFHPQDSYFVTSRWNPEKDTVEFFNENDVTDFLNARLPSPLDVENQREKQLPAEDGAFGRPAPAAGRKAGSGMPSTKMAVPPRNVEGRCSSCGATSTPQWRNGRTGLLCNACGVREHREKKSRAPLEHHPYSHAGSAGFFDPGQGAGHTHDGRGRSRHHHLHPHLLHRGGAAAAAAAGVGDGERSAPPPPRRSARHVDASASSIEDTETDADSSRGSGLPDVEEYMLTDCLGSLQATELPSAGGDADAAASVTPEAWQGLYYAMVREVEHWQGRCLAKDQEIDVTRARSLKFEQETLMLRVQVKRLFCRLEDLVRANDLLRSQLLLELSAQGKTLPPAASVATAAGQRSGDGGTAAPAPAADDGLAAAAAGEAVVQPSSHPSAVPAAAGAEAAEDLAPHTMPLPSVAAGSLGAGEEVPENALVDPGGPQQCTPHHGTAMDVEDVGV